MNAALQSLVPNQVESANDDRRELAASHGRGSNWIHPSLEVRATSSRGFGVFARQRISTGDTVVVFGGKILTTEEFDALPHELQHFPFQIEDEFFLGPRGLDDIGVGERINHSCSPNLGFKGAVTLVAISDIAVGEEVTIDYATCVASDRGAFTMECRCWAPRCRGTITGEDWQLPDVQSRLLPYYQPFIQEKVRARLHDGEWRRGGSISSAADRVKPDNADRRQVGRMRRVLTAVGSFIQAGLRQEWMAIPICVIAGIPSTLATLGIMAVVAPALRWFEFAQTEAAFISMVSIVSSVVGYCTYLIAYYIGMAWKERRQWIIDGRVDSVGLRHLLRVIKCDFIAHLPSDLWVMPLMGAATGGFFFAGISQMWSILLAHTLADVLYAIKEPLFWHGAKQFVAWQDRKELGLHA